LEQAVLILWVSLARGVSLIAYLFPYASDSNGM
jgi:hypothetical protein